MLKIFLHYRFEVNNAQSRHIADKGVPLKKTNNNYWRKKCEKFFEFKKEKEDLEFKQFSKLDFKDTY